ncbi:hypothetical protein NDU88_003945 [Pleurodeles waltl]|uniref:Uncharacterized protein n=1 Tax=Pleurodeles waltl TaxID=8319 RepID=A0AAV7LGP5_PLEWA|nr:hypothetical protein NDU88_003945 [Pleurodeles waltl]
MRSSSLGSSTAWSSGSAVVSIRRGGGATVGVLVRKAADPCLGGIGGRWGLLGSRVLGSELVGAPDNPLWKSEKVFNAGRMQQLGLSIGRVPSGPSAGGGGVDV